jgi:hypothetical protein
MLRPPASAVKLGRWRSCDCNANVGSIRRRPIDLRLPLGEFGESDCVALVEQVAYDVQSSHNRCPALGAVTEAGNRMNLSIRPSRHHVILTTMTEIHTCAHEFFSFVIEGFPSSDCHYSIVERYYNIS